MEPLVTTYLQMFAPPASRGQKPEVSDQNFEVRELTRRDWKFNREMYFKVGENWKWIDRRPWTDGQWKNDANDPNLRTFAGYCDSKVAGYFELHRSVGPATRGQETENKSRSRTSGCCQSLLGADWAARN
jgi:hypothetical protein